MCHIIPGRFWSKAGGFLSSAWAPPGRTAYFTGLQFFHLHQASSLNPEAAGTRRPDLQAAIRPGSPWWSPPDLPSPQPQLPTGIPCTHVPRRPPQSASASQISSDPTGPRARLHRPAHRSNVGWWKQEVATKVVTNKVLNGASNFPFHLSSLWRLGWNTQWYFEWQVPPPDWPSLGVRLENPRVAQRPDPEACLGGGPPEGPT